MAMDTPLFIEAPRVSFPRVKHASAQLSEDHSKWAQEILNQLFKDVPEASEYTPTVSMIQADEEQGYAIGVIVIKASPDTAMSADRPTSGSGIRQAVVPFFVKSFMLLPLDIIVIDKGRMVPLTPERLREALFKPQTFSLMTKDWGDQSLYNMFYPPGRGSNDFGSGVSMGGSGAGANYVLGPGMKFSMLDTIGASLSEKDLEKVSAAFEEEPALRGVMKTNQLFAGAIMKLAELEGSLMSGEDVLTAAVNAAPVHVAQMGYDHARGQYWVKTASRNFFWKQEPEYLGRREMLQKVGEAVTTKIDTEGTVTLSDVEDAPLLAEDDSKWEIVEKPGIYRVRTQSGKELTGWVIPGLVDFDGNSLPMTVFTNGAVGAVQDEVLGSHVSTGVNLPDDEPRGAGVFYVRLAEGVQATVPVQVMGHEEGMDGSDIILVKTLTGGSYSLKIVPGLKKMIPGNGDHTVMMPDSLKFMSLDQETPVPLVSSPDGLNKTAAALARPTMAIFGDGSYYGVGIHNAPNLYHALPKTASYTADEIVYALCLGGHSAHNANTFVKRASRGRIEVPVTDIKLASSVVQPALEKAKLSSAQCLGLRKDLVKEAAVLPDIQTVDSVLSLGFINPENVRTFVSRLPYLEKALSQICELVLAARMGLTEVPEFASARAARGLDETIQGLRSLAMREVGEASE